MNLPVSVKCVSYSPGASCSRLQAPCLLPEVLIMLNLQTLTAKAREVRGNVVNAVSTRGRLLMPFAVRSHCWFFGEKCQVRMLRIVKVKREFSWKVSNYLDPE